jgi:hypothetical protein
MTESSVIIRNTNHFQSTMISFNKNPTKLAHELNEQTCMILQRIAKSLYMKKFYNTRKSDLVFKIIHHITNPSIYQTIQSKHTPKTPFILYDQICKNSKQNLFDINEEAFSRILVKELVTHAQNEHNAHEKIFINQDCTDNTYNERRHFGRSENGCKPGWVHVKQNTVNRAGCYKCIPPTIHRVRYINAGNIEAGDLMTHAEHTQLCARVGTEQNALDRDILSLHDVGVDNGRKDAFEWIMKYAAQVQTRMVMQLEQDFEAILTINDVDMCTDEDFESTTVNQMRDSSSWLKWVKTKIAEGVNVIGYVLKILFKISSGLLVGFMSNVGGVWSMAKTLSHVFVFHPRSVRVMLFIIRRQLKKMCRWLGDYLVKEKWVEGPNEVTADASVNIGDFWSFVKGIGLLDKSRVFSAIINSDVVSKASKGAGKHAGTLVSSVLSCIPLVGNIAGGITTVLLDITTETLTDAMKIELEAQMWSDDIGTNIDMLVTIINPMKCIGEMPAYQLYIKRNEVRSN